MGQGEHWIVDILDFPDISARKSLDVLVDAAKSMKATIVNTVCYESSHERTAMVLIDESHLTIHDYRNGMAGLDIFTCGNKDMQVGFDYVKKEIGFENYKFVLKTSRF